MKRVRRIITLCLVIVILCSAATVSFASEYPVTGYYGTEEQPLPYPVTSWFMDSVEDYRSWYKNEYGIFSKYEGSLAYLSRLWFDYFKFGDIEVWHEAYLQKFSFILGNSVDLYIPASETENGNTPVYRLASASWNENRLTVQCSADITVRYDQYEDNQGINYVCPRKDYDVYAVLAVKNADTGNLVYLGDVEDFSLVPQYRYGRNDSMMTSLIEYELKYVSKVDGSFEAVMPEFFDSEKHTLELYFRGVSSEPYAEDPEFYNKYVIPMEGYSSRIKGDANGDGRVNLADASLVLKHIARWEGVAIDKILANVNGDTSVNLVDVAGILKIIAGWKSV